MNVRCETTRAALSKDQKLESHCSHLSLAYDAKESKRYAEVRNINAEKLALKLSDEDLQLELTENCVDGMITVYILPGNNIVVPSIQAGSDAYSYVHIR